MEVVGKQQVAETAVLGGLGMSVSRHSLFKSSSREARQNGTLLSELSIGKMSFFMFLIFAVCHCQKVCDFVFGPFPNSLIIMR